jgi:integrase
MHPHFTTKRVSNFQLEPGKKQTLFSDGHTPGLGLRVTAGSRSYIFETTLHGRSLRKTIGDIRTWTLGRARDEATRLKSLTDQGIDPRKLEKEQKAAAEADRLRKESESVLVSEPWGVYMEHYATIWGPRHLRDHRNLSQAGGTEKKRGKGLTTPGVLYPLLKRRLTDISSEILVEWLTTESKLRQNNARQGFELFRTFWRWAAAQQNYKNVINPAVVDAKDVREIVPSKKTHKSDVLQTAQLQKWFLAVRGISNPVISAYLQSLLLTGARREELAELRWAHVDFEWRTLWVKDKVSEAGREIPLSLYVMSLIKTLPRINEWVFSSRTSISGHISEPRIAHDQALATANLKHVTIQGLRRTFSSLAEWLVMPKGITDQIQGHAPNSTADRHYTFRPTDLLGAWHQKYENWILTQAGIRVRKSNARRHMSLSKIPAHLQSIESIHPRKDTTRHTASRRRPAPSESATTIPHASTS